ncbi:hypothetical protein ACFE04_007498 [Oxalis oulophora]
MIGPSLQALVKQQHGVIQSLTKTKLLHTQSSPHQTLLSFNTTIKSFIQLRKFIDALKLFVEMLKSGQCSPDNYTYSSVIKAATNSPLRVVGIILHGRMLVGGFSLDPFVNNSLLAMYMNYGDKVSARKIFDAEWDHTVVSWNTMINGYFKNRCPKEAMKIFDRMASEGVEPDCGTAVSILPVCGFLKDVEFGRKVHKMVEESDLSKNIAVNNALVDMYMRCGIVNEAKSVFDEMSERDVITWTSMINSYIQNGEVKSALALCPLMQLDGVRPNAVTLASLLSACDNLDFFKDGQCLHAWAVRQKLDDDVIVETSMIDMYAKCKHVDISFKVFDKISKNRTAPWNAMISGCIHNGIPRKAIMLFKQMQTQAIQQDDATLNSLLPAYATLADLCPAMSMHDHVIKSGFLSNIQVCTSLIDIYGKCGDLESAQKFFSEIPEKDKDIYIWSVIIAGYGTHGHGETAVSLFKQMVRSGTKPNEVTFTSVLHACSHGGLVDDGLNLFNFMLKSYASTLRTNHYTCIVDLLGRAGRLDEAYDMIRTMPFSPSHAVWGALLGACVVHENVEFGEEAAKHLFELEPENTGNYVLLAKIYSAVGRWKEAENVRHVMDEIGLRKAPAHSLVEVRTS